MKFLSSILAASNLTANLSQKVTNGMVRSFPPRLALAHTVVIMQAAAISAHSTRLIFLDFWKTMYGCEPSTRIQPNITQPLPHNYPWAKASVNETNPYTEVPTTGVIRSYHFVLSRGWLAPDGVQKWGIL